MNLFVAIFEDDVSSATLERVKIQHPKNVYEISNRVLLIRSSADNPLTISEPLGMAGNDAELTGVVFKLNGSHSGYYYSHLWDWLTEARELPVG